MLEKLNLSTSNLLRAALYDDTIFASGALAPADLAKNLAYNADPSLRLLTLKVLRQAICYDEYNKVVADQFGSICRILLLSNSRLEMMNASALLADFGRIEEHRSVILFNNQMLRDMLTQRPSAYVQRGICAMLGWTLTDQFLEKQIRKLQTDTDIANYLHAVYLRSNDVIARRYALVCLKLSRAGDVFDVATMEDFYFRYKLVSFVLQFAAISTVVTLWTVGKLAVGIQREFKSLTCNVDGKERGALWHMTSKSRATAFTIAHHVPLPRWPIVLRRGAIGGLIGGAAFLLQGPLCDLMSETRRFNFCHARLVNKRKIAIAERKGKQRRMPPEFTTIDGVCRSSMLTSLFMKLGTIGGMAILIRRPIGQRYLPFVMGPLVCCSAIQTVTAPHVAWT